jgi:amino acid transporter
VSAEEDQRAAHSGELEERREEKGRRPGERIVRIVRPHRDEFRRAGAGVYVATEHVLRPETPLGRAYDAVRRVLIGKRLPTEAEAVERVSKKIGLAIFASDNISSSAYATEEMMRVLVFAGAAGLALTIPLHLAILVILGIVVLSYLQAIRAYPGGGGSYIVASENLGMLAGLVAAASLIVDYILTVSVSVASGVAALGAAIPWAYDHRVAVGLVVILVVMVGNLRGIRESGNIFAAPTYLYVVSLGAVLLYGLARWSTGTLPQHVSPQSSLPGSTQPLALLLVLRAFASGASGLTGVEAVANGVQAFKEPVVPNAGRTLLVMAALFGALFFGVGLLATAMGVLPDQSEQQTVLSQITAGLVGNGSLAFWTVQIATMLLLTLAANTSFNGFPRLTSILAGDHFLPRIFRFRGDRLVFTGGIVVLAIVSSLLIVAYQGSVTGLIPLYTVGVFIAFTLSQAGLVKHWYELRTREPGWRWRATVNALGAATTGIVALEVAVSKFVLGAWMVLVLIPLLIGMMWGIRQHYLRLRGAQRPETPLEPEEIRLRAIVPIAELNVPARQALAFARAMADGAVTAVHVTDDPESAERLQEQWRDSNLRAANLVVIESPYRSLAGPLLRYIDALHEGHPQDTLVIVLPEYVPSHWWEHLLHNQTALRLKAALLFHPGVIVANVPYHLAR